MDWFKKAKSGLTGKEKKEIPDGLWSKCPECGEIIYTKQLEESLWVCPNCEYHFRIPSHKYIRMILDNGELQEYDVDLESKDPLRFKDSKKYPDRIKAAQQKTGAKEGVIAGMATIGGIPISFAI